MASSKLKSPIKQEQERVAGDKSSLLNKNLHLSIEVREDNLFACLLDKDTNQYLAWSSFNSKEPKRTLENILEEEILNYKCSGYSVVFTHNSATLVPSAFFSPDSVKGYLKQQNLIKPGETACYDFIKNNDCYSAYAVGASDYILLKHKYPHAVFRHHSSVFVEYLLALHKATHKNEVHVYVFPSYMDIVVLQSGKLILYNRYQIKTPDDFTYFLLWIYEELKLKQEDSICSFYGEIEEKSEMFDLAAKYLKNTRLAEKTKQFTFSPMLESLPAHRYYSLFMQYQCI